MNFEERFPSLCKTRIVEGLMKNWEEYEFLFKGDDPYSRVEKPESAEYVDFAAVMEHCLDKQKVREVIGKIRIKAETVYGEHINFPNALKEFELNLKEELEL